MALTKREEAKVGTFDFHAPNPASDYDPRSIGVITIYQYGLNAKGDALKSVGTPYKVRFERAQTDEAVKRAKKLIKDLNAGTYEGAAVITIPTGRPRGRQKATA